MNTLSRLVILQLLFLPLTAVTAQSWSLAIAPGIGLNAPESNILKRYYQKNFLPGYGGEIILITDYHGLGLYIGVNRVKHRITDELQTDYDERMTTVCCGFLKRTGDDLLSADIKAGMSIQTGDLFMPGKDTAVFGYEFGLTLNVPVSGPLTVSGGMAYSRTRVTIPAYMTTVYSRHQYYLSGRQFTTGGFSLMMGFSYRIL